MALNKEIRSLLNEAARLAFEEVEIIAREALKGDSNLHSFQMCMGTYFFCDRTGEILHDYNYEKLDDFIIEWDGDLKITGEALLLKKSGGYILKSIDW